MSKWQPIETVPKPDDGSKPILLLYRQKSHPDELLVWDMGTGWRDPATDIWHFDGRALDPWDWPPTHWMPLPAPPGEEESCDTTKIPHEGTINAR